MGYWYDDTQNQVLKWDRFEKMDKEKIVELFKKVNPLVKIFQRFDRKIKKCSSGKGSGA